MSRIEKALEKAVEIRKSVKEVSVGTVTRDQPVSFKGFQVSEAAVNTDMVDKHIVCITDSHSAAAEQYKKLRAKILKATTKNFQNTIMITSADMGEGKTVTAINLAVALANEIDHSVLLIDADLKRPSVHKYLGLENIYGLSDYLMGRASLPDLLIKTGIGKLVLLPAGSCPENPTELLSSDNMRGLVHDMKHRYKDRYIIFDSPPILVTSDSLSLSSYVDGVVLVIQAARTTHKAATSALSQLNGSNILGVVFNNVPSYQAKNLYPYYYLYGNEGYYQKSKNIQQK